MNVKTITSKNIFERKEQIIKTEKDYKNKRTGNTPVEPTCSNQMLHMLY